MNKKYMEEAIKQAKKAYKKNEVPIGAIIVKNNKIIAKSYNMVEKYKDATKHAEIIAINKASKKLKNWRLIDCDLYVTLEPCQMCSGAINASRIKNVYYMISKTNKNVEKFIYKKIKPNNEEYLWLLQSFFKEKRG